MKFESIDELVEHCSNDDRRYINDGIYDITGITFMELKDDDIEKANAFTAKHPNFVLVNAYETESTFLLSEKPQKKVRFTGTGFNHGSTTIMPNCPKSLLILAEND